MMNKQVLKKVEKEGISEDELYGAYKIFFGTLVSGSRLKIINLLRGKKMNVGEIMKELNADQSAVSHDLARLRKCGFVKTEIKGKYRDYYLNEETILPIMSLIDKHMAGNCVHMLRGEEHCCNE